MLLAALLTLKHQAYSSGLEFRYLMQLAKAQKVTPIECIKGDSTIKF